MGKKKIKESYFPENEIKVSKIDENNKKLIVSYEHLCMNNKKYSLDQLRDNKVVSDFARKYYSKINEYSQFSNFKKQIATDIKYRQDNHIHPIDWSDKQIKETCFTCLKPSLMEQIKGDCWQLGISTAGRIHGFFIENMFYVVWIDAEHNLYERRN